MGADLPTHDTATRVVESAMVRRGMWFVDPLVGAVVVWLLRLVSTWVAGLPWAPFQGVFQLFASLGDPWGTVVALAIGAVIGLGFAGLRAQERLSVAVDGQRVELARGRAARHIERDDVAAVFREGGHLVLLDESGGELARQATDLPTVSLRKAFTAHGFPWRDGDPHAGRYREWREDDADLSPRQHALLAARARALRKHDRGKQAALLRDELLRHGVVVRDDGKRQRWRAGPHHD
ncbi:YqeB family protein [Saccharopolyspora rosea]|uniref:DUF308 domain-containing protein n=1 Tax=Saccharopolyspora rosea TaxID=524884 RepID=A0ABW3FSR4_9PSEU|nr:hypothetical protein [Saccharopolyspora rosea]